MRSFRRIGLLLGFLVTSAAFNCQAQSEERYFFQKGATYFTINQRLNFSLLNQQFDGNDIGDVTSLGSRLRWNRAISDRFAVGATDQFSHSVTKNDFDFRQVNTQFNAGVGAAYAFQVGKNQLITDLKVGFGQVKNEFESGGNTSEFKDDLFTATLNAALPIQLYQSDLFFVPNAGYRYKTQSGENQDIDTRSILFGLDMSVSVPCNGWWYNQGVDMNREFRYTPGTQMWGNSTKLAISLGDITNKFSGGVEEDENRNRISARFDYSYYITQNFAVGGKASFNSITTSQNDSDFKTTDTWLSISPRLRWHPFKNNAWNDVYIEGGGGFRTDKTTTENGGSSENKENTVLGHGGIGKFVALTPNLFLNPSIQYTWSSSKDPDGNDDLKFEESGVQFTVGLNYSF